MDVARFISFFFSYVMMGVPVVPENHNISWYSPRAGSRLRAVKALHPAEMAYSVTVPMPTSATMKGVGLPVNWVLSLNGFSATLATDGGDIVLYRGGSTPYCYVRIEKVSRVEAELIDNGNGYFLPAVVVRGSLLPDRPLGFFTEDADKYLPPLTTVRAIAEEIRQKLDLDQSPLVDTP